MLLKITGHEESKIIIWSQSPWFHHHIVERGLLEVGPVLFQYLHFW